MHGKGERELVDEGRVLGLGLSVGGSSLRFSSSRKEGVPSGSVIPSGTRPRGGQESLKDV